MAALTTIAAVTAAAAATAGAVNTIETTSQAKREQGQAKDRANAAMADAKTEEANKKKQVEAAMLAQQQKESQASRALGKAGREGTILGGAPMGAEKSLLGE